MGVHRLPKQGRSRVVIENVAPEIDGGRFAIKRTVGEKVVVEADVFADGHDLISAAVKYRANGEVKWSEAPMQRLEQDRWRGEFQVSAPQDYSYTVEAWIDRFKSWRNDFQKRVQAGQKVDSELAEGSQLIKEAAEAADGADAAQLSQAAIELNPQNALDPVLFELVSRYAERRFATTFDRELRVTVDPERGRFSAWYEMFPRSFGTLKDCEAQLPRVADMGFDVLYFPPIHPIGRSFRKGRNNNPSSVEGEPGSPWGIGADEGGHKSVHPELGTLDDFRHLIDKARGMGIEIAMDIAFQCSPDHPYVREHPGWFRHRPDGTIHYAENPPKKYQDIYPFDFECDDWEGLWLELKSIFEFWMEQGVTIFRVDNPHTKAFPFWEWCIGELKRKNPRLIFLSEAFTRPSVMYRLAKLGFTQSYSYFPWRNTKYELTEYLTELTSRPLAEYFRPSLWPNTPDILPQFLQIGGRPAFAIRLVLAATLGANYGIYGPAFELCENLPIHADSEEYLDAEKFEVRHWDVNAPHALGGLISKVNRIRRENPALQFNHRLRFHRVDNDSLIAYTKTTEDGSDIILTVVNLSPQYTHSGWLELPVETLLADPQKTYQMHDLLTEARYLWKGPRNYVELNPQKSPAHIFRLRQHVRTERDFDYFM